MKATSHEDTRGSPRRVASLLLGAALLLVGCAGGANPNPFRADQRAEQSVLEVDNRHWADMTISIRRGGQVIRLGQVTTNGRQRFQIPVVAGGAGYSVQFIADPVGSGDVYESPLVALGQGEHYVWTLAVAIEQSTLVRR